LAAGGLETSRVDAVWVDSFLVFAPDRRSVA